MVACAHNQPILTLSDGRLIYRLDSERRKTLLLALRRYFSWLDAGRAVDVWRSGVGYGIAYDTPRVTHGAPVGGYGPGSAVMPEDDGPDAWLLRLDAYMARLSARQRTLLRMKAGHAGRDQDERKTISEMCGIFQVSEYELKSEWRKLSVETYFAAFSA